MTDALSTQTNFAIIIFVDKTKLFIGPEDYQRLLNAMADPEIKSIKIGQSAYTIGGVSKVLTLEEFYNEYPDQKPAGYGSSQERDYSNVPDRRGDKIFMRNGLYSMIKGINSAIAEFGREGSDATKAALAKRQELVDKWSVQYGELPNELKIT